MTALVVSDTVVAMEQYGAHVIRTWRPRVVAVTGTVGKTGAKELIADVLASRYAVFRTPGNFSGRFGLAVALGGLEPEDDVAVGRWRPGLRRDRRHVRHGPARRRCRDRHRRGPLGGLGRRRRRRPRKGIAAHPCGPRRAGCVGGRRPRVRALSGRSAAPSVTYGTTSDAGYRAGDIAVGPAGTTFTANRGEWSAAVVVPWLGAHSAGAALAALAVADHFGVDRGEAVDAIGRVSALPGRLRPLPARGGGLILDDTYNAAPRSVHAGLDTLARLPAVTRIAVIGDMAELGDASEELHRQVGGHAAQVVDRLVTLGNRAAWVADAAVRAGLDEGKVSITFTAADAAREVADAFGPDAVVLVKGSAAVRMERVVEPLLAEAVDPTDVLVRQDRAWRSIRIVEPDRPTWTEVDLSAVGHNVRWLTARAAGADVMVVLKADAYGHGAVQVAHTALRNGATRLGVACVPEARSLRRAGIRAPILVLGYTPGWQGREAIGLDALWPCSTSTRRARSAGPRKRSTRLSPST